MTEREAAHRLWSGVLTLRRLLNSADNLEPPAAALDDARQRVAEAYNAWLAVCLDQWWKDHTGSLPA